MTSYKDSSVTVFAHCGSIAKALSLAVLVFMQRYMCIMYILQAYLPVFISYEVCMLCYSPPIDIGQFVTTIVQDK